MCVCGVRDVLADDLLPNNTLRDTINRILDTGNSSADNTGGSVHQGQGSVNYFGFLFSTFFPLLF